MLILEFFDYIYLDNIGHVCITFISCFIQTSEHQDESEAVSPAKKQKIENVCFILFNVCKSSKYKIYFNQENSTGKKSGGRKKRSDVDMIAEGSFYYIYYFDHFN